MAYVCEWCSQLAVIAPAAMPQEEPPATATAKGGGFTGPASPLVALKAAYASSLRSHTLGG